MLRTIAFGAIIVVALSSGASAAIRPFVVAADTKVTRALVVCGPLSQWRKECQPKGPVYRHHHSHCFHHAGMQRCT